MKILLFKFGSKEAKIENFLFLQKEIITALDIVFTDFTTGDYNFVPPDSIIEGYYRYLHHEYLRIYLDKKVVSWLRLKGLRLTNLHMFRSLALDFDIRIEFWNALKEDLLKEKKFLDSYTPHGDYVDKEIKLHAYEMEKLLEEHKVHKEEVLNRKNTPIFNWNFVTIDMKKCVLVVKDKEYAINPNTHEFIFLINLIQNVGNIVHYKELANILRLNAYRESIEKDIDIARSVQEVKKRLKDKLVSLKVPKKEINTLLVSIQSISGSGYQLLKSPQVPS